MIEINKIKTKTLLGKIGWTLLVHKHKAMVIILIEKFKHLKIKL
jgi:hypothetical protein